MRSDRTSSRTVLFYTGCQLQTDSHLCWASSRPWQEIGMGVGCSRVVRGHLRLGSSSNTGLASSSRPLSHNHRADNPNISSRGVPQTERKKQTQHWGPQTDTNCDPGDIRWTSHYRTESSRNTHRIGSERFVDDWPCSRRVRAVRVFELADEQVGVDVKSFQAGLI